MDMINQLVPVQYQALAFQGLVFLSMILPVLERLAAKTKNKVDDGVIAFLEKALKVVPRVR